VPVLGVVGSIALIFVVLLDAFEAMVLPRRVNQQWRPARLMYRYTWKPWSSIARRMKPGKRREAFLSLFGPLSILALLWLWAVLLMFSFAVLQWSIATRLNGQAERANLLTYFYLSAETFSTLGLGDITPMDPVGRGITVAEAGLGFGFLAVVIGYLPVIYQAFSRRETSISQLDARAGSPPTAGQVLLRWAPSRDVAALESFLREWERWSAELLESHISFPMLSYYRSQHDNQSWLAALTAILDTCALIIAGVQHVNPYQAQLTLAMARHASVDLALIFNTPPRDPNPQRLPPGALAGLKQAFRDAGLPLREGTAAEQRLDELRAMYEPFLAGLSAHFLLPMPPLMAEQGRVDNWQTSAWMRRVAGIEKLTPAETPMSDEHFD